MQETITTGAEDISACVPVSKKKPGESQVKRARKRARSAGVGGSISATDWLALVERQGDECACCGDECALTIDHVIPLSKGGPNTIENVQGLCGGCNERKGSDSTDYRGALAVASAVVNA